MKIATAIRSLSGTDFAVRAALAALVVLVLCALGWSLPSALFTGVVAYGFSLVFEVIWRSARLSLHGRS